MSAQRRTDGNPVSGSATQRHEDGRPRCPQFRPCNLEELLYPIQGHCIRSCRPGWLMIPSIEEYSTYCTRSGFAQCCWFSGCESLEGTAADEWGGPESRKATGWPTEPDELHLRGVCESETRRRHLS